MIIIYWFNSLYKISSFHHVYTAFVSLKNIKMGRLSPESITFHLTAMSKYSAVHALYIKVACLDSDYWITHRDCIPAFTELIIA